MGALRKPTDDSCHGEEYDAAPYLPSACREGKACTLARLADSVQYCRGCPLYCNATQAVFGEGPETAELVLVGEQPGDSENEAGRPFIGPAGKLLDKALEAAEIPREKVYITNAVKHFKHKIVGATRRHVTPGFKEFDACKPWLVAELNIIRPKTVVALGASAGKALLDRKYTLTCGRGQVFQTEFGRALGTYHPSAALRAPDSAMRHRLFDAIVEDLRKAA